MKRVFLTTALLGILAGCASMPSEADMADKCGDDMDCRRDMIQSAEIARQEFMQRIGAAGRALSESSASADYSQPASPPIGFLERHYVDGFNRVCVYNSMGSEYMVTISSASLCPLSPPR
jgi:hypothetical protein